MSFLSLEKCKKHKVKTCGIVNVVESSIARLADFVLPIHAGPEIGVASTKAFLGQRLVLYLLTLKISKERNDNEIEEYKKMGLDIIK
jgi:glucosamine--fructose-6-phosphate aminotransferase (isomerizing)